MEIKRTCWNCEAGQYNLLSNCLICLNQKSGHTMQPVKMDGCCEQWTRDKDAPDLEE